MGARQELITCLQQIVGEHLGVEREGVTEESTWTRLGADSLDRLDMSMAIEDAFKVDIPHRVGEQLNTIGETVDHLLTLIAPRTECAGVRIEAATTDQQMGRDV